MSSIYKLLLVVMIAMYSYIAVAKKIINLTVDDSYPPFSYNDESGNATGLYVEIIKEVAKTMPEYEIIMKAYPWKRALLLVERGKALGVVPPYIKLSRTYIDIYSSSLFSEEVILLCNKKINLQGKKKWPTDFAGMKIGNTRGYLSAGNKFFVMSKEKKHLMLKQAL